MPNRYRFHCPVKIVSGESALDKLPGEIKQLGAKRPLIITDPGVAGAGLLDLVHDVFDNGAATIGAVYDQVPPESPVNTIHEIVEVCLRNDCDALLAVGGGSAIDTAKGVKIKLADPSINLLDFKSVLRMAKPTPPLVVIPTTAGTGSEVTSAAVIADPETGIKLSLISPSMPPDTAVIDPRMTATLPPRVTASTGMDALTHAIESYIGIQKNPISDGMAEQAIELIAGNLVETVKNGQNLNARMAMSNAATMAGMAFSNSMVAMVHALGHALGAVGHVAHGDAMALCLPDTLAFNLDVIGDDLGRLLLPLGGEEIYLRTPRGERGIRCIEAIRELRKTLNELCGLPTTLTQAGVSADKLPAIAELSTKDGAALYNRKKFTAEDALHVLQKMM